MVVIDERHGLGAVLGALVGDAAGAVLEFFGRPIAAGDVDHAMTLPGGGVWKVAPGQVTDDGELTMSLLHALAEDPEHPAESAAVRYARWAASGPFDIGATTQASIGCLRDAQLAARAEREGVAAVMTETARERCMRSKANGALMRATPLGVWGARRERDALVAAATADTKLSHPNPACTNATVAYAVAIRHLLRAPADVAGAFAEAAACVRDEEVSGWLREAEAGVRVPFTPMDGFVRIGFTHAFRHLAAGTPWEEAVRETLAGGGDTDTNACIVGGLLGARWGWGAIPAAMREGLLGCRVAHARPPELHPRSAPDLVRALLA